jgi:pimeloyl-ACP methyl ester carboxylesterase
MLCACASMPTTDTAAVAGATIAYTRAGQGAPPVILQSGLGDDRAPWAEVFRGLESRHTVFAYDRPGYGGSSATPGPRDPCSVATETRAVLAAAGLKPPYILVGHSLGGLYQYVYARLYPEDVAGLVLLDPTHPRHWEALQRDAPGAASAIRFLRTTLFTAVARREFDDQARCLDKIDTLVSRQVPAQILVSTRFSALEGQDYQAMLWRLRDDWLRLTGAAACLPVANSGHYIQRDAPVAVVRAIEELAARRTAP